MFDLFKRQSKKTLVKYEDLSCEWSNKLLTESPQFYRVFNFNNQKNLIEFLMQIVQIHSDLFFIEATQDNSTQTVYVSVKIKTGNAINQNHCEIILADIEDVYKHTSKHERRTN